MISGLVVVPGANRARVYPRNAGSGTGASRRSAVAATDGPGLWRQTSRPGSLTRNEDPQSLVGKKTAEEILDSLTRCLPTIHQHKHRRTYQTNFRWGTRGVPHLRFVR